MKIRLLRKRYSKFSKAWDLYCKRASGRCSNRISHLANMTEKERKTLDNLYKFHTDDGIRIPGLKL